jgi:hypothetical protein
VNKTHADAADPKQKAGNYEHEPRKQHLFHVLWLPRCICSFHSAFLMAAMGDL